MSLATKRLTVYLRIAIVATLVGAISLVLYKNRSHSVPFWFFGLTDVDRPINVVWLIWFTAGAALLVGRIVGFARGLIRDMREVRRMKTAEAARQEQMRRAAELDERERRLNEKLATPIGEEQTKDTSAQGGTS